jgi:dipeptidyl-peptidase-4
MKRFLIPVLLIFFTKSSIAQNKLLNKEQCFLNKTDGIIQRLPQVKQWKDETSFFMLQPLENGRWDTLLVNAKDGSRKPVSLPVVPSVFVEAGDIKYRDKSGESVWLTRTAEDEKNPILSPDGFKLAFTRDHNLFIYDLASKQEKQLTFDSSKTIYNGYASWVYYEEILGRASNYAAFWWSPDSRSIAFMRFDDSQVPEFPIYSSTGTHGYLERTRYPKAGDNNPVVQMGIYLLPENRTQWINLPGSTDSYLGRPFWMPGYKNLCLQWMNRAQDTLMLLSSDIYTGATQIFYTEHQSTWVDWKEWIHFNKENEFLILSDVSGWRHLYKGSINENSLHALTRGNWQVTEVLDVSKDGKQIWLMARKSNSTTTDLLLLKNGVQQIEQLTKNDYTHNILLSPGGAFFIDQYSDLNTPDRLQLCKADGTVLKQLGDSRGDTFDEFEMARQSIITVPSGDGFDLPVHITWPLRFDSSKKYPLWISIYGGPDAGTVKNIYRGIGPNQWLAREDVIQIAIDHRGSGHFGKAGMNYLHRNLGNWEIKDYITVVQWFINKGYIDQSRIGINGFSYGGYITCLALTKGAGVFTHGIAGGSVTDWKLYDSHYTERYMDAPAENESGYQAAAIRSHINQYSGMLYLIHGTMDDNVHLQQTLQLTEDLQKQGKEFQLMVYPGGRHGWGRLKEQWKHYQMERYKFIYRYILKKPIPENLIP